MKKTKDLTKAINKAIAATPKAPALPREQIDAYSAGLLAVGNIYIRTEYSGKQTTMNYLADPPQDNAGNYVISGNCGSRNNNGTYAYGLCYVREIKFFREKTGLRRQRAWILYEQIDYNSEAARNWAKSNGREIIVGNRVFAPKTEEVAPAVSVSQEIQDKIGELEAQFIVLPARIKEQSRFSNIHRSGSIVPAGGDPYAEAADEDSVLADKLADEIVKILMELIEQGLSVAHADALLTHCYLIPHYEEKRQIDNYWVGSRQVIIYDEETPQKLLYCTFRYGNDTWGTSWMQ